MWIRLAGSDDSPSGVRQYLPHRLHVRRLGYVVIEPRLGGAPHVLWLRVPRHRHEHRARAAALAADLARHLISVLAGQADVAEHDFRLEGCRLRDTLVTVSRHLDDVP